MSEYTECFDGIRKRMGNKIDSSIQYLKGKFYALDEILDVLTEGDDSLKALGLEAESSRLQREFECIYKHAHDPLNCGADGWSIVDEYTDIINDMCLIEQRYYKFLHQLGVYISEKTDGNR